MLLIGNVSIRICEQGGLSFPVILNQIEQGILGVKNSKPAFPQSIA